MCADKHGLVALRRAARSRGSRGQTRHKPRADVVGMLARADCALGRRARPVRFPRGPAQREGSRAERGTIGTVRSEASVFTRGIRILRAARSTPGDSSSWHSSDTRGPGEQKSSGSGGARRTPRAGAARDPDLISGGEMRRMSLSRSPRSARRALSPAHPISADCTDVFAIRAFALLAVRATGAAQAGPRPASNLQEGSSSETCGQETDRSYIQRVLLDPAVSLSLPSGPCAPRRAPC